MELREIATNIQKCAGEIGKNILVKQFFEMMCYAIKIPFDKINIHLKGIICLGDLLMEYFSHKDALIYYLHAVFLAKQKKI